MRMGVGKVSARLSADMPLISAQVQAWMTELAGGAEPVAYFLHPAAFPTMLLPWWLEHQLTGTFDPGFQTDLIFSNAILYYYTRMVDNVMDGHATVEPKLLPAAGYFVSQGYNAYRPWFGPDHPFWDFFAATWSEYCDVTAADGQLEDTDEQSFTSIVSRKVCAAKISVAAVCFHYEQPDALPRWSEWIDVFGRWHLFQEDLFDWQQDLNLGVVTYILCEARRRKRPGELEVSWFAREGLDWGFEKLVSWMRQLRQMTFAPEEVLAYLDLRERDLYTHREKIAGALAMIRQLSQT